MTVAEIARLLGAKISGNADTVIRGVAKIEDAGPADITFIANARYVKHLETTQAGAVLIAPGSWVTNRTLIEVNDPYADFVRLLTLFHPKAIWMRKGIHPTAVVEADAVVDQSAAIGAFCYIGPRTTVGSDTVLYPHVIVAADVVIGCGCEIHSGVTLREGTRLGNRVVIQDGAVIGSDGFGFAATECGYEKIPQSGIVIIEDDVEIGANTTIDRATMGRTVIGKGTKLDNLIQIGHNVSIGSHTVIAAQSGVSGSSKIGDQCRIGGQVGIVGHLQIGDRVMIGAQSGVSSDVPNGDIVSGSPARAHGLWKRIEVALTRLPDLLRRVRDLESAVFKAQTKDKADS